MVELLIGPAVGAVLATALILGLFKVQSFESWQAEKQYTNSLMTCCTKLVAENARLRVSLAAGEMTEEGKRVAEMTMAALGVVAANNSGAPETERLVHIMSDLRQEEAHEDAR